MDNTDKYLHLKHNHQNIYEIVDEIMTKYKSPLMTKKKIKEIFPHLSLIQAKEVVIIGTSKYKSLYDYQKSLFADLEGSFTLNNSKD